MAVVEGELGLSACCAFKPKWPREGMESGTCDRLEGTLASMPFPALPLSWGAVLTGRRQVWP